MATSIPAPRLLSFDNFQLDVRSGELRKHGIKLRLQGQPLQVLAALLDRPGDVVSLEELRAQIWSADTFVDFDHSLHNAIARLREVLGDSAESPRYIETLPRRGYRFIAPVKESSPGPSRTQAANSAPPVTTVAPVPTRRIPLTALALIVVSAAGLLFWNLRAISRPINAAAPVGSIAVLPLENLSGDPGQQFFADGMTEQLITELAKVGSLRVISRTSAMQYKGTKKSLPQIARELNVDSIVEGSVIRSGQQVRVTAQLLNAASDRHLWAETYERNQGDVLKLQSEVAFAIAQQVRAQLNPPQQLAILHVPPTVNPQAYESYLRGRYYFFNETSKPASLNLAKGFFEESLRLDPGFALAYAGLGNAYAYLGFYGDGQLEPREAYRLSKEALSKALQLDDSIGEVHDTLGTLDWRYQWDWDAADKEYNRALALAPSYSCAHEDRAMFLSFLGRRQEALAEVAKSVEIDPGLGSVYLESAAYYQLRDYNRLIEVSRSGVAARPDDFEHHFNLAIGYEGTGKLLEAVVEYQRAVELSNGALEQKAALAHAFAAIGRTADAQQMLSDAEQRSKTAYVSPYLLATFCAAAGQKDQAFAYLEKAYAQKSTDLSWFIKSDLRLESLRSDPRFQDLLRRLHLPG